MNKEWADVRAFHEAFGHPSSSVPTFVEAERAEARAEWMREEIDEFLEARDICEQYDAMIDLIYFALGTLVELGVPPAEGFEVVHRANMSKLGSDGKPIYRADGKTVKPAGWRDPREDLVELVHRIVSD
jgi:predicted HAD superfamily Cof-like phosphohydrolase